MTDISPCIGPSAAGIMTILKTDNNPGLQVYYQGVQQRLKASRVVVHSNCAVDHLHVAPQP